MLEDNTPNNDASSFDQPHLKDFYRFLPELNKESDRGRVLMSCSYLDDLMRRILLAFFIDRAESEKLVEGFNAPLGTLATRTAAAYALGLLTDQEFKDCETIRTIRNRFAHNVHASFDAQDIHDLSHNLTMAAHNYRAVVVDATEPIYHGSRFVDP